MLARHTYRGTVVISQPAHAAVSAQIARQWGNPVFGSVAPGEEVSTAALLHDIGWIEWERRLTLNHETGQPHTFLQLPIRTHLRIWEHASRNALVFGRYPALLTSLHFTGLYGSRDLSQLPKDDAATVSQMLASERAFQSRMIETLRADPAMAPHASDAVIERNRRLVAIWDALSLALCHGVNDSRQFPRVPTATEDTTLHLSPRDEWIAVDPWPFDRDEVELRVDGRLLVERFTNEKALHDALATAPWVTIIETLRPS